LIKVIVPHDAKPSNRGMTKKIRYVDFFREVFIKHRVISYNAIIPKPKRDATGNIVPFTPTRIRLRPKDVHRLIRPYLETRFVSQFKTVVPLAVYLALFQLLILRQVVADSWIITAGLFAVIVGLMLFMEGLKLGLMPFGETIGNLLPKKSPLWLVLLITFLLGIGVTLAEPAIGALKAAGAIVPVESAPYLYALLNQWSDQLVLVVGAGVGLAAVAGTLRFLYSWSLKPLIYITLLPTLGLTAYGLTDPELEKVLGLAWDTGAVTTGPVTVPLVLALGIGIAASGGKGQSSLSGFGIVTLASLFPIVGVTLLAIYVIGVTTPEDIISGARLAAGAASSSPAWHETTPGVEMILGLRATLPLILFLGLVLKLLLREDFHNPVVLGSGLVLAILGMIVFNIGLTYGLAKLGSQSGGMVPAAFTKIAEVRDSPLYVYAEGVGIALLFAWLLGFGATLAEPALNALGITVENLTQGVFKKSTLIYAVSSGVGTGIALGLAMIIFSIPLAWLVIPGYLLAAALTFLSSEEFVNVAWDSAGVTTGPITVPLVLALGLGFANAVGAIQGFGILALASIGPILSVLSAGLWVSMRAKYERKSEAEAESEEQVEIPAL
jgi:hypothetical protein